jgi:hypothetical protein
VLVGSGYKSDHRIDVYSNQATRRDPPLSSFTDCGASLQYAGLGFDGNGELLATTFGSNTVERFNSSTGERLGDFGVAPEGSRTTLNQEITATTIAVASTFNLHAGDLIEVGVYQSDYESARVAAVSAGQVTLERPLVHDHKPGEIVKDLDSHKWFWCGPESIATDSQGNVYVGQADCSGELLRFDKYGNAKPPWTLKDPLDTSSRRGTDHIALAPGDDCTLYWTSEGTSVKRFNVCTGLPMPDLTTAPLKGRAAYALQVGPNGEIFVADSDRVVRLSGGGPGDPPAGTVMKEYELPLGGSVLFGLSLDPDGQSFWVASNSNGVVARFAIASGELEQVLQRTDPGEPGTYGGILVVPKVGIKATGIEVTQVVQNQKNTDLLVAHKRTYAIVRAKTTGLPWPAAGVPATLQVCGTTGDVLKPRNGRVTIGPAPTRDTLISSFIFALPDSWETSEKHLCAVVNPDGAEERYPAASSSIDTTVDFTDAFNPGYTPPHINLTVVDLSYETRVSSKPVVVGTTSSYDDVAAAVRNLFPLPDGALHQDATKNRLLHAALPFDPYATPPGLFGTSISAPEDSCDLVLDWLLAYRQQLGLSNDTILYGAITPAPGQDYPYSTTSATDGCAEIKQPGKPSLLDATGDPARSLTAVHEVGHVSGLEHTFSQDLDCEPLPPGEDVTDPYPALSFNYASPYIDPDGTIGQGYNHFLVDPSDWSTVQDIGIDPAKIKDKDFAGAVKPPSVHDVMSYCEHTWMSGARYSQLFGNLIAGIGAGAPRAPSTKPFAAAEDSLSIAGTIGLADQSVQVGALFTGSSNGAYSPPGRGPYHLRLLDGSGTVVADYPFTPGGVERDAVHPAYPVPSGSFTLTVPFSSAVRRVSIYSDNAGAQLWSQAIAGARPSVTVTTPAAGTALPATGPVPVTWSAAGTAGAALTYSVLYSPDGGTTWDPVASDLAATSTTIDAGALAGAAGTGILRVVATDGVRSGFSDVGGLTVPDKPPAATIDAPVSGTTITTAQALELDGSGFDPQAGALTGTRLSWVSSRDGFLGTGNTVIAGHLSPGTHTITLTATTPDGRTATASTVVTVGPDTVPGPTLAVDQSQIVLPLSQFGFATGSVDIENTGSGGFSWTAAADDPRISLFNTDGQAPGHLGFHVDTSGLPAQAPFTAHIIITAPGAANNPQVVTVTADGTGGPRAVTDPDMLAYPATVEGSTQSRTVTFTNTGPTAISLDPLAVSGGAARDFAVTADSCSGATLPPPAPLAYLKPGGSCRATVRFGPTTAGARSAYLVFADAGSDGRWFVPLSGEGAAPPASGTLVAWGDNRYGEAGNPTSAGAPYAPYPPTTVASLSHVAAVAGGDSDTLAVTADGTLWGWGSNAWGALGSSVPPYSSTYIPQNVWQMSNVAGVAGAQQGFSVALKHDGTVWEWGNNAQIGFGTQWAPPVQAPVANITAVAAGNDISGVSDTTPPPGVDALAADGTVWDWTEPRYTSGLCGGCGATQVAGPGGTLSGITAVAFRMALRSDGTVWTWGDGTQGQLGNGTRSSSPAAVEVLDPSGSGPLTGVIAIASRLAQRYALKSDGTVLTWGSGLDFSQYPEPAGVALGLGPGYTAATQDLPAPVVGPAGTGTLGGVVAIQPQEALRGDGTVWTWGGNRAGELGVGTSGTTGSSVPVEVDGVCGGTSLAGAFRTGIGSVDRFAIVNPASIPAGCPGSGPGPGPAPVTGTLSRPPDSNGWYDHPVQVTWADPAAGATCDKPATYGGPEGAGVGTTGYCTNPDGTQSSGDVTLNYDATAPLTTAAVTGTPLGPGLEAPVTVTLTATDATSGVATTSYTIDGSAQASDYTGPIRLASPGYHTVTFWSTDKAGNVEPHADAAHTVSVLVLPGLTVLANLTGPPPGARVALVDDTTGHTTALEPGDGDGYHGSEVVGPSIPVIHYHYTINGASTGKFSHTVTAAELATAVVSLNDAIRTDSDLTLTGTPRGVTVTASPGASTATVTYTPPVPVDEGARGRTASCTPASGSAFPAGQVTTVNCTARDIDDANSPVTSAFGVNVIAPTSLNYTGTQIVIKGTSMDTVTPAAQLTSGATSCATNQPVAFSVSPNPTGAAGPLSLGSGLTNSAGLATGPAAATAGWATGAYTVTATFGPTTSCGSSSDQAALIVGSACDSATGGGWYNLPGSGRINFGFTIQTVPNSSPARYKGQLVMINQHKWRLTGSFSGAGAYTKTAANQGSAAGTGDLYWWNQALNKGRGAWQLAIAGVGFTISFTGGTNVKQAACNGTNGQGCFGINITYTPRAPQPAKLPNSPPQPIKGGSVQVH